MNLIISNAHVLLQVRETGRCSCLELAPPLSTLVAISASNAEVHRDHPHDGSHGLGREPGLAGC